MIVSSTSRAALASIPVTDLEQKVLDVIDLAGAEGCISDDIQACYPTLSYSSVTARFSSLEEAGAICRNGDTRPGVSGRQQKVMRLGIYATGVVKPTSPKEKLSPFVKGMMHAIRTLMKETDLLEAKKALRRELIKAAKR